MIRTFICPLRAINIVYKYFICNIFSPLFQRQKKRSSFLERSVITRFHYRFVLIFDNAYYYYSIPLVFLA